MVPKSVWDDDASRDILGHPPHGNFSTLAKHLANRPYVRRGVPVSGDTIRIVLADDHTIVREGLRLMIRSATDLAVVGEAKNGTEAVKLVDQLSPDVVLLDLEMSEGDGMHALREIVRRQPHTRALILTVHDERERLLPLLECGARGYLTKEATSSDLIEAVRVVASGDIYVRPAVARMLAAGVVPTPAAETPRKRFEKLSDRERSIVRLLAQGYSGAEIARELDISGKTVAAYKSRIQEKLGLSHRTEYVRFALEAGILAS
jgi:DNA-binding NarL/FixJ family response regulator